MSKIKLNTAGMIPWRRIILKVEEQRKKVVVVDKSNRRDKTAEVIGKKNPGRDY